MSYQKYLLKDEEVLEFEDKGYGLAIYLTNKRVLRIYTDLVISIPLNKIIQVTLTNSDTIHLTNGFSIIEYNFMPSDKKAQRFATHLLELICWNIM